MPIFSEDRCAKEAIDQLYRVRALHPFLLHAFVIMPDHCHFVVHPIAPTKISTIMRVYKSGLAFELEKGSIWQSRFDLQIVDNIFQTMNYVHNNPVKAGLVKIAENYRWSSASKHEIWQIDDYV
jgi:REP element-mobilizing transposase RayT